MEISIASSEQVSLINFTGGNCVVPVRTAYCLKTSLGLGPSIMKISITPDSENQWVSVCGASVLPLIQSPTLEKKF